MRVSCTCPCGEEVFFDIDTVAINSPSDLYSITDRVKEEVGDVDRKLLEQTADEIMKGSGLKKIRFFPKCPKCGAVQTYILWTPLS